MEEEREAGRQEGCGMGWREGVGKGRGKEGRRVEGRRVDGTKREGAWENHRTAVGGAVRARCVRGVRPLRSHSMILNF